MEPSLFPQRGPKLKIRRRWSKREKDKEERTKDGITDGEYISSYSATLLFLVKSEKAGSGADGKRDGRAGVKFRAKAAEVRSEKDERQGMFGRWFGESTTEGRGDGGKEGTEDIRFLAKVVRRG